MPTDMPVTKGIMLGIANVMTVATLIAAITLEPMGFMVVVMFGMIPGIVAGAVLGAIAGLIGGWSRTQRAGVLTALAIGAVYGLAAIFGQTEVVPVAGVPTIVAALVLERWTRRAAPPPPIPVATAQSIPG